MIETMSVLEKELRTGNSMVVSRDQFRNSLKEYFEHTKVPVVNLLHLMPQRISGSVYVNAKRLHAVSQLFLDNGKEFEIFIKDKVGVLVCGGDHHVIEKHVDEIRL